MAARSSLLSLLLGALVVSGCDCGGGPPDDTFDGNVIVGDGSIPDSPTDAEADATSSGDVGDSGRVDSSTDGGADARDAAPDAGDRCSEPAVAVLTATEAVDQISTWAGMIVEITGTATRTALDCTDRTCPQDMPCCNTCTATVTVGGRVSLLGGECFTPPPECSGSECAQVCRPLLGLPQRFRGTLRDRGAAGVGLELFSVSN